MSQEALIAIFGSLITLGLGVNAHFIKSLWESITEVKSYVASVDKTVAVHTAEIKHLTSRMDGAEKDIRFLRDK